MKVSELVPGKEYWFDGQRTEKGTFVKSKNTIVYFNPIGKTTYLTEPEKSDELFGMVGFVNAANMKPVES
jgi:hypothetical protein